MFTNPLDSIRIASPCKSDWNEMYGDERRRFCGACKLNVYNLSGMTRQDAESLLMNSEGRLCVRFFRRKDGTVLTKDCPVGWQALKRKASRFAVAFSSLLAGVLAGTISFRAAESALSSIPVGDVPVPELEKQIPDAVPIMMGEVAFEEWEGKVDVSNFKPSVENVVVGRIENVENLRNKKVKAWIK